MSDIPQHRRVLAGGLDVDVIVAVHREVLQVLRPVLDVVEIDPTPPPWPDDASKAVEALYVLAERQGRWPTRRGLLRSTGVRLDPRIDQEFAVAVALSACALLADGSDRDQRNIFSASDSGDLWLTLTEDQEALIGRRLLAVGLSGALIIQPHRSPGGRLRRSLRRPR